MRELTDPETLRDRGGVAFVERTRTFDGEEADVVREQFPEWTSHAAVGVVNESGEVLLVDDGHHGWTLPPSPVDSGEDYVGAGRERVTDLLDTEVAIADTALVRRIDLRDDAGEHIGSVYNVVLRAEPVNAGVVAAAPAERDDGLDDAGWYDRVPDGAAETVADDIELILD